VNEQDVKREMLLESLQYVDCYLPNEEEIKQVAQKESLDAALEEVINKGAELIVVKMGAKGCRIKSRTEDMIIPGFNIVPITTVGAGDTFNAGFVSQYVMGKSLEECARFANACAAVKVSENKFPELSEVEKFLVAH
ncbi:MAG: carbohydrate kinase family protein, partial [Nitrosotalea sp.]